RAHLPAEGTFQCSITRLSFKVKSAVTITYRYAPWTTHLSMGEQEVWKPVGPLFHIEVQAGVVQAVHLPHFICMAVKNTAWCYIAHFQSGKITLETPTKVTSFSAVLENPSFSLVGVLWRKFRYTFRRGFLPVHSLVLIFQQLSAARTTLHLYLIPDDNSVKQAIEKQEMNWNSKLIPKPHPLHRLFIGHSYLVTSKASVVIMPEAEFPFWYKSPRRQQLFLEIYIKKIEEEIELLIIDTENDTEVWKALVRSGRNNSTLTWAWGLTGAAFLKRHKTELCSRMSQLDAILLRLRDTDVINSDEEEEVLGHNTRQRRNRALLELAEKKGLEAQELLFQILQDRDPFLISDLETSSE
ncbi:CARD8 protein, partial [Aegotheles bennettii]|nr:CARD8 protein [Aegotheles bennettii]